MRKWNQFIDWTEREATNWELMIASFIYFHSMKIKLMQSIHSGNGRMNDAINWFETSAASIQFHSNQFKLNWWMEMKCAAAGRSECNHFNDGMNSGYSVRSSFVINWFTHFTRSSIIFPQSALRSRNSLFSSIKFNSALANFIWWEKWNCFINDFRLSLSANSTSTR